MAFVLGQKSLENLAGVHPDLVRVVKEAIKITKVDFSVIEGVRTLERQKKLLAEGHSQTLHSKHLIQADGFGHAVDLMAVGDLNNDGKTDHQDKSLTWEKAPYLEIAKAMTEAAHKLGVPDLRWGGLWKTLVDLPHFQLGA